MSATDASAAIDGFDPLGVANEGADEFIRGMAEESSKRLVQNVLNSYAGFYDLFCELIQNALDALQQRGSSPGFVPTVWISIDVRQQRVRVVDNGVGMTLDQFKFCLRPSVSFKRQASLRGHKGVGATYLAYGFSFMKIQTKQDSFVVAATLRQGREWADDQGGTVPRPTFEAVAFDAPELLTSQSGTAVEILLGGAPGVRPKDLGWIGAHNAEQWLQVLRMKTPLGGVYLSGAKFRPNVNLQVIDAEGNTSTLTTSNCEYFYPHEIEPYKTQSVKDIVKALDAVHGDAATKFQRLGPEFKRLDCIYEVWGKEEILDASLPFSQPLTQAQIALVERHNVILYGAFLRSAKLWGELNDEILLLRKNQRLIHGGLQLASDGMVQGDLSIIPLTSTIGYQANSHIVVHFTDGNPDMGRKVFQPELKALAESLAIRAVNTFKRYLQHLKPDTGATAMPPGRELHDWVRRQEGLRDSHPLSLQWKGNSLSLISTPQQEQDVVALFHELLGIGLISGLKVFATSQHETYDSLFFTDYSTAEKHRFDKTSNPLGAATSLAYPSQSEPRVLEYKYDFQALVEDFSRELKYPQQVHFVVCWKASPEYKERFFLRPLLRGDEGSGRTIFGATHQAYATGSNDFQFEVLILEDLLRYLRDPAEEEARQKILYDE